MIVHETKRRVLYAETDKMGVVYYGSYPMYYEAGRNECLRHLGLTYREMETMGTMMPVADMNLKYIRSAKYDDLITIKTIIPELPSSRMLFQYEIYLEDGTLINKGNTTLAFVNMETNRPCRAPEYLLNILKPHFENVSETV